MTQEAIMRLNDVVNQLELKKVTQIEDRNVTGVFISDMLSDVMSSAKSENLWITVQTHKNIVSASNLIDISAVIIPNGKEIPEGTIELANRFHVNILSTNLPVYELVRKLVGIGIN